LIVPFFFFFGCRCVFGSWLEVSSCAMKSFFSFPTGLFPAGRAPPLCVLGMTGVFSSLSFPPYPLFFFSNKIDLPPWRRSVRGFVFLIRQRFSFFPLAPPFFCLGSTRVNHPVLPWRWLFFSLPLAPRNFFFFLLGRLFFFFLAIFVGGVHPSRKSIFSLLSSLPGANPFFFPGLLRRVAFASFLAAC